MKLSGSKKKPRARLKKAQQKIALRGYRNAVGVSPYSAQNRGAKQFLWLRFIVMPVSTTRMFFFLFFKFYESGVSVISG